jgi:uncharacterized membrane protein (UPF0127 family)
MLYNLTKQKIVARQPVSAGGFIGRLRGLMFRQSFPPGRDALLLYPCRAVHSFFMRFPIDLILVDKEWRVVNVCRMMKPGSVNIYSSAVTGCVELPAGAIDHSNTATGDQLILLV